ncbi:TonB-dependent receptor domain-containing protein [Thalassotalea maritima]|uniref:TonB-dependent receptor domain-containing protein n=1 Tax=Thalassotalea maritima TaxID=3242416 RepID=UPI003527C7A7
MNKQYKNNVTPLVITLGVVLTSINGQAIATPASKEVDEHVIITANRNAQAQFLALSSSEIFTADDIGALQAANIAELLDTVAGINIASQGGAGQTQSIFTRGSNANHTLVLIDGIRVNSATLGYTNISTLSPQLIDRIEVVKGPRAALWGSDAIGGVIQIFTKQYGQDEGSLAFSAGSHGFTQGSAAIGLGNEQHRVSIAVNAEQSDGFNVYQSDPLPYDIDEPDEDGYDKLSASVNANSKLNNNWTINAVALVESGSNEYDASYPDSPCWDDPTQTCPVFYANEQAHDNVAAKLSAQYQTDHFSSELSYGISQDKATTFGNGIDKAMGDQIKTKRDQISFINQLAVTNNIGFTLGFDYYNEKVSTNTDKDVWTDGFQSWAQDERDVSAVFAQTNSVLGAWLFEVALRYDNIENIGDETTYNLSLGYQLTKNTLFSISQATAFKTPSFNDLYWPGAGNPNLAPEYVDNTELLLRHRFAYQRFDGQVEVVYFKSDINNLIAWAPNAFGVWQPANVMQADIEGYEVSLNINTGVLSHTLNYADIDAENTASKTALLRRPQETASYQLSYDWHALTTTLVANYHGTSLDSAGELDSYVVVDIAANYALSEQLTLNAKVNNLLDQQYQSVQNYIADGINYKVGVSYQF